MNVVEFRPEPKLNDIPAQLRQMADRIESGELSPDSFLCLIPTEGWPDLFGWGAPLNDWELIGVLELAKTWLAHNNVERS